MSNRLIPSVLIVLLYALTGTTVQAMGCEWIYQPEANAGTELNVSHAGFLEIPIHRTEHERLLGKLSSYSDCIEREINIILSDIASSSAEGAGRAQSILTLDAKFGEMQGSNENNTRRLFHLEQKYAQIRETVASSKVTIKELIGSLELELSTQMRDLEGRNDELELKLELTASQIEGLEGVNEELALKLDFIATQISDLKGVSGENASRLGFTDDQITELTDTDNRINSGLSGLRMSLTDMTLYGIVSILLVMFLVGALFMALRKKVLDHQKGMSSNLEGLRNKFETESINLDGKLVDLIENQIAAEGSRESASGEIDHSLVLKIADEIIRIQQNILKMDPEIKGIKQLSASIRRIQNNYASNGYDIVDMLNKPYDEGMNAAVNFIFDEKLNANEQVITRITKPQVNYRGVMVQSAQIDVSKGE